MNFHPGETVYWIVTGVTPDKFLLRDFVIVTNDGVTITIEGNPADPLNPPDGSLFYWDVADFPMTRTVGQAINVMNQFQIDRIARFPTPENIQYFFDFQKWIKDFIF